MKPMIIFLMVVAPLVESCAQHQPKSDVETRQHLGWDLTYQSILDANGVGQDEWIRKWLRPNYQSPVKGLISAWTHGPIQSSILREYPAPHAGERTTMWFVRTKSQAYYYERVEGKPPHETAESLNAQAYDIFFNAISKWEQAKPLKPQDSAVGGIAGYNGFLSVYDSAYSRQMLLTSEDFTICDTKQCETWKPGRLFQREPRRGQACDIAIPQALFHASPSCFPSSLRHGGKVDALTGAESPL